MDDDREIEAFIVESVETSLEKLGVSKVNCVMLHHPTNLYKNGKVTAKHMKGLIRRGYTDMVGASVYTGYEVAEIPGVYCNAGSYERI